MPFNEKRFKSTKYVPRTEAITLPDLAHLFDGEPIATVRGLTGEELASVNDASSRNRNASALIEAIAGKNTKEIAAEISSTLGFSDASIPDDLVKRIEYLMTGGVDPVWSREMTVKLFKVHPVSAYKLSNAIIRLTGKGSLPGESSASGTTAA